MEINKIQEEQGGGGKPFITAVGGGEYIPPPPHTCNASGVSYHAASVASGLTRKIPGSDSKGACNRGDMSVVS